MELGRINTKPAADARRVAKRGRSSGDSFSVHLDHVESAADSDVSVEPVAPVLPITSLIATQEAEPEPEQEPTGRQWGRGVLDGLSDLRQAMIHGEVTPRQLDRIRDLLETQNRKASDPQLKRLLHRIETRARVELAKFGR